MSAGPSPQTRSLQAVSPHARHFGDDIRYIALAITTHELEMSIGAVEVGFCLVFVVSVKGLSITSKATLFQIPIP